MEPQGPNPIPDPEREHRAQSQPVPGEAVGTNPAPYATAAPAWLRYGFFLAGLSLMGWLAVADTSTFFHRPAAAPPPTEAALQDPFPGEIRATAELVSPLEKPPGSSLGMLKTTSEEQGIDFSESELPVAPDPAQPPLAPEGAFGAHSPVPESGPSPVADSSRARLPPAPGTEPVFDRPQLRPFPSGGSRRVLVLGRPQGRAADARTQLQLPGAGSADASDPMIPFMARLANLLGGIPGAKPQQAAINLRIPEQASFVFRCPKGYWLNSIAHTCCPGKECCEKRDPRGACTLQGGGPPGR